MGSTANAEADALRKEADRWRSTAAGMGATEVLSSSDAARTLGNESNGDTVERERAEMHAEQERMAAALSAAMSETEVWRLSLTQRHKQIVTHALAITHSHTRLGVAAATGGGRRAIARTR